MTDAVIIYAESMPNDVYAANTVPYIEHKTNINYIEESLQIKVQVKCYFGIRIV